MIFLKYIHKEYVCKVFPVIRQCDFFHHLKMQQYYVVKVAGHKMLVHV